MTRAIPKILILLSFLVISSCASQRQKDTTLDRFAEAQSKKLVYGEIFEDADFLFSATAYHVTLDDIAGLKQAWFEFANTFPASHNIETLEKEVAREGSMVFVVALYMTEYENADLKNKNKGWAVGPTPVFISELDERDAPLRALMPVKNDWARYYLVKYNRDFPVSSLTISNRIAKVELKTQ